MNQDRLLTSLAALARDLSIPDDVLRRMLDDEIAALAKGARVHDYLRIFAIRRVSRRMRSLHAAGGPSGAAETGRIGGVREGIRRNRFEPARYLAAGPEPGGSTLRGRPALRRGRARPDR
nr:DUF3562 domain-containing protein [Burkholderia pyrrocinia]